MDQLLNSNCADIFSLIVSYLWIREWVAMSRASKSFRIALFREVVNHAIWQRLASHIYFSFSISVTELYLSDDEYEYDAETYFQARRVHDWFMGEDRPSESYDGIAAIPGTLVSNRDVKLRRDKFLRMFIATVEAYELYMNLSRGLRYAVNETCQERILGSGEKIQDVWRKFYTYDPRRSYATQAMSCLADIGVFQLPGIWHNDAPKALRALESDMEISHLFE